jgi:hypothetical protein
MVPSAELWVIRGNVEEGLRSRESVLEAAGPDAPAREVARIQSLRSYLLSGPMTSAHSNSRRCDRWSWRALQGTTP